MILSGSVDTDRMTDESNWLTQVEKCTSELSDHDSSAGREKKAAPVWRRAKPAEQVAVGHRDVAAAVWLREHESG
jgi:hypothetical protein